MTLSTWLTFFAASWLISLSPGAGAVSCMSMGMRYGYVRSIPNIFGLQVGASLLLVIVALGLGAALSASAIAFETIRWFGVAYLLWLGVGQWRAEARPIELDAALPPLSAGRMFMRAVLINLSNPKAILFMLAVLPQFIDPAAPQWPQYGICIATIFCTDAVVMSGYVLLAARVFASLRDVRHLRWLNRFFGSLFIGVAVMLATFKKAAP